MPNIGAIFLLIIFCLGFHACKTRNVESEEADSSVQFWGNNRQVVEFDIPSRYFEPPEERPALAADDPDWYKRAKAKCMKFGENRQQIASLFRDSGKCNKPCDPSAYEFFVKYRSTLEGGVVGVSSNCTVTAKRTN